MALTQKRKIQGVMNAVKRCIFRKAQIPPENPVVLNVLSKWLASKTEMDKKQSGLNIVMRAHCNLHLTKLYQIRPINLPIC